MKQTYMLIVAAACIGFPLPPDLHDDRGATDADADTDADVDTDAETGDTATTIGETGDTGFDCGDPQPNGTRRIAGDLELDVAADAHMIGPYGSSAGSEVVGAGDLTGDGLPDLVVGSPVTSEAFVVPGPPVGLLPLATAGFVVTGDNPFFTLGMAGVDADGDGQLDLAIFGDGDDVFVVSGPIVSDVDAITDNLAVLESAGPSNVGSAMDIVRDVNGDGIDDLFVGGGDYDAGGVAFIVPAGSLTGVIAVEDIELSEFRPRQVAAQFGNDVSAGGDHDGDGVEDYLIGAYNDTTGTGGVLPGTGAFFAFDSTYTGFVDTSAAEATVYNSAYDAGVNGPKFADAHRLDFGGDVNGDGYDDVLVGRRRDDSLGASVGTAYLILGPLIGTSDVATIAEAEILGKFLRETSYVNRAGDLDGDDFADFAAGGGDTVFVFYGPGPSGVVEAQNTADARLFDATQLVGFAMDDVGDLDGDCYPDLLIGGPSASTYGGSQDGSAWLIRGGYL